MPQVTWSARAETDLTAQVADHALRARIKCIAEEILQDLPPSVHPADHGAEDGVCWRRCITREQERRLEEGSIPDTIHGSWHYFLLYRKQNPAGIEVIGLCGTALIASWELMYRIRYGTDRHPRSA